jgi:hypothetical protein
MMGGGGCEKASGLLLALSRNDLVDKVFVPPVIVGELGL